MKKVTFDEIPVGVQAVIVWINENKIWSDTIIKGEVISILIEDEGNRYSKEITDDEYEGLDIECFIVGE